MTITLINSDGDPVEIGEGRGDLRSTSVPFDFAGPWWNGRPVSYARIYQSQPWVAIAVMRLLTWSVRVPLKVYRRIDDQERQRLHPNEHPLARAVVDPWERGSMADLVTSLLGPLFVHGNGLTNIEDGPRGQIRFAPVDWRSIMPIRLQPDDPNSEIVGWKDFAGDGEAVRSAETVMHLKWWSPLGQLGISPLEQLRTTIVAESAAVEWTINNLAQAARPSGVVELSDSFLGLDKVERQQLLSQTRDDFRAAFAGPQGAGKLPVLPPGVRWTTAQHTTAVEAELIEQRRVNRNEVSAAYMLPPPMIGILDKATYSNIATQREMAYTDGLAPPLVLAEQTLNAYVRGLLREDDIFLEFDFGGLLRGDPMKQVENIRAAVSTALLTPNEGRDLINRSRSTEPGADKLYLPRNNLRAIDEPTQEKAARS